MCDEQPVQACACCPKGFCQQHAVQEASNVSDPVFDDSGRCELVICNYCQQNTARIQASYMHDIVTSAWGYHAQELYTASGLWLSMYTKQAELLSARDFSTQCYRQDMARFEQEVSVAVSCCSCPAML